MTPNVENHAPEADLVETASAFRHLRGDAKREREGGATRRRQHAKMDELARRFETLLARWIPDESKRDRWRAHLHRGEEAPASPTPPGAVAFKGRTETGTTVAVYLSPAGAQEVHVDGRPATRPYEHVALGERPAPVRILGREFQECFDAPEAAVDALRRFFEAPRGEPPWEWARALLDDGLIDRNFSLTARGRRLLGRGA